VHCLAGAHRAGTTGILTLMHFTKMSCTEAQKLAISIRPIINPISDFPELLALYDKCIKLKVEKEEGGRGGRTRNSSYSLSCAQDLSGSSYNTMPTLPGAATSVLGPDRRGSLSRTQSTGEAGGSYTSTAGASAGGGMAGRLAARSDDAIANSLALGKSAASTLDTAAAGGGGKKKKAGAGAGDSARRRRGSSDSVKTATAAGYGSGGDYGGYTGTATATTAAGAGKGSSWLRYQQKQSGASAATLPRINGAAGGTGGYNYPPDGGSRGSGASPPRVKGERVAAGSGGGGGGGGSSSSSKRSGQRRSFDPDAARGFQQQHATSGRRGSLGAIPSLGV
jgi:hypothetical protein